MPTNKNALTRYKILDDLLANRYHAYTLNDLTEVVNDRLAEIEGGTVTRRTIEKDINDIEFKMFYADIERYRDEQGRQCLRYADSTFSIFKKAMSDDEKYLLKEALRMLGQFQDLPNFESLERLRASLNEKEKVEDRKIVSFAKNPLEGTTVFGEIFNAISNKQVIRVRRHTFSKLDECLEDVVYPYLLKEYNKRWFLFAGSVETGKIINIGLERIDEIEPLPSMQYVEYDGNIDELFDDYIGVTLEDSPLYKIVFWVSDRSKDYVSTKPLHDSQRNIKGEWEAQLRTQYPSLENGRFFEIECKENYELIRELMSFGSALVVVSPSEIQNKVKIQIEEMKNRYDKV